MQSREACQACQLDRIRRAPPGECNLERVSSYKWTVSEVAKKPAAATECPRAHFPDRSWGSRDVSEATCLASFNTGGGLPLILHCHSKVEVEWSSSR